MASLSLRTLHKSALGAWLALIITVLLLQIDLGEPVSHERPKVEVPRIEPGLDPDLPPGLTPGLWSAKSPDLSSTEDTVTTDIPPTGLDANIAIESLPDDQKAAVYENKDVSTTQEAASQDQNANSGDDPKHETIPSESSTDADASQSAITTDDSPSTPSQHAESEHNPVSSSSDSQHDGSQAKTANDDSNGNSHNTTTDSPESVPGEHNESDEINKAIDEAREPVIHLDDPEKTEEARETELS